MYHLRPGIGLLEVVGHRDAVELRRGVVALEYRARVFPGHGRAGLHLGPAEVRAAALAYSPLGHEVEYASLSRGVAGIPVLHGAVLHVRVLLDDYFDHRRMELVLVPHRSGAAFHIAHRRALVRDYQRPLELSSAAGIDTEIARQVHRTFHALGYVAERAVREHGRVECGVEVVAHRHHAGEIAAHELGILPYGLGEGAEYYALLGERLAEGRRDAYRIEDRVYRDLPPGLHSGKHLPLVQGDAQLVEGLHERRIDLRRTVLVALGSGIVYYVLKVYLRQPEMSPAWRRHLLPPAERVQPEVEKPLRLPLLGGNQTDYILVQPLGYVLLLDIRHKTAVVLLIR